MNEDAALYADTPQTEDAATQRQARERVAAIRASHDTPNPETLRKIRGTQAYFKARALYRHQSAARRQPDGTYGDPCIHDGQPIDYSLTHPNPMAWTLEHIVPVVDRPELIMDSNNFASAHSICNTTNGAKGITSEIGTPSEDW